MLEKILAFLASCGALFFAAKAWLAGREADKAKAQLNEALVNAERQEITAHAKGIESEKRIAQTGKEDAIQQADSGDIGAMFDSKFPRNKRVRAEASSSCAARPGGSGTP